ncbi:MAG: hypothetical protein ACOY3Y_04970 [Acidobacteriota bacterium]
MLARTTSPVHQARHQRGSALTVVAVVLAFLVIVSVAYTALVLTWSYSEGERSGLLLKFSRKGWLCKTWEGELHIVTSPGVMPQIWHFTVRDEVVAAQASAALGKRVVLHYTEHKGVPTSCFGETSYFVDGVRVGE